MYSEAEQIAGLKVIQVGLYRTYHILAPIVLGLGDVVAMPLSGPPRDSELVYALGGYDGWAHGELAVPDMDVQRALDWAFTEIDRTEVEAT
jgi:hypothetical protein